MKGGFQTRLYCGLPIFLSARSENATSQTKIGHLLRDNDYHARVTLFVKRTIKFAQGVQQQLFSSFSKLCKCESMLHKPWCKRNSSQLFFFSFLVFLTVEKFSGSALDIDAPSPHFSYKAFTTTFHDILDLSGKSISDHDVRTLSEHLKVNNTLTRVVLSRNNIGDGGAAHLSEALKVNRALDYLDVSANTIGDSGAVHLSEAQKVNRRLERLYVAGNKIGGFSRKVFPENEGR